MPNIFLIHKSVFDEDTRDMDVVETDHAVPSSSNVLSFKGVLNHDLSRRKVTMDSSSESDSEYKHMVFKKKSDIKMDSDDEYKKFIFSKKRFSPYGSYKLKTIDDHKKVCKNECNLKFDHKMIQGVRKMAIMVFDMLYGEVSNKKYTVFLDECKKINSSIKKEAFGFWKSFIAKKINIEHGSMYSSIEVMDVVSEILGISLKYNNSCITKFVELTQNVEKSLKCIDAKKRELFATKNLFNDVKKLKLFIEK